MMRCLFAAAAAAAMLALADAAVDSSLPTGATGGLPLPQTAFVADDGDDQAQQQLQQALQQAQQSQQQAEEQNEQAQLQAQQAEQQGQWVEDHPGP